MGRGAGLWAALTGNPMSTRVGVCRRACAHDCSFDIVLTEGSLTGLGDLYNWEHATEHLWAYVPICWGGDRAWRSCRACTEHRSHARLNSAFWDGRGWTGVKSSSEKQELAVLELETESAHLCHSTPGSDSEQGGWTWEGDVKGQLGCPCVPPVLGVSYMLCRAHASSTEQICLIWVRRLFSRGCRCAGTA